MLKLFKMLLGYLRYVFLSFFSLVLLRKKKQQHFLARNTQLVRKRLEPLEQDGGAGKEKWTADSFVLSEDILSCRMQIYALQRGSVPRECIPRGVTCVLHAQWKSTGLLAVTSSLAKFTGAYKKPSQMTTRTSRSQVSEINP